MLFMAIGDGYDLFRSPERNGTLRLESQWVGIDQRGGIPMKDQEKRLTS
jgi:hypothetical protein